MPGVNFTLLREVERAAAAELKPLLEQRRRELLDQAESLMHNGTFNSDADRDTFDRLLDEVKELNQQLGI